MLARAVLGSSAFMDLSAEEYGKIISAKKLVLEALALEEKFDLAITNYLEFEKTLNDLAAEHMVRHVHDYNALNECRLLINQRVQNLLGACRLYLDHGDHHAGQMEVAVPGLTKELNELRAKEYDTSAAYRIAEALRNHSQHRGFPIGSFSIGGEWTERQNKPDVNLYRIEACIDVQAMREGGKTKATVLADLDKLGKKADVRPILRQYVESLAAIHEALRRKLDAAVTESEQELESAMKRFETAFPNEESYIGLTAYELDDFRRPVRETAVFMKPIDRRKFLVQRNGTLVNLSRRHVSSEIT